MIAEMDEQKIKVEFIDNDDAYSGYNIFTKNIGPSEMYLFDLASDDQTDYLYQLTNYDSQRIPSSDMYAKDNNKDSLKLSKSQLLS